MSLQEVPALPAPLNDPFWSSLRVKPHCTSYLGSLEGQRQYESAWVGIRKFFEQKEFSSSARAAGAYLRSEYSAQAEWHEPTWQRPRIEQGNETCLVRKDFFSSCLSDKVAASIGVQKEAKKGRSTYGSVRSGRPPGWKQERAAATVVSGSKDEDEGVEWDITSLWNIEQALARSDIVGMGRLRCTCRALRVPRGLLSSRAAPMGFSDIKPLVSVTSAYLAELPISGGQLYYGSFMLPVRASDFPNRQSWFSCAISEEELAGPCLLLCSIMPNCFEFVSGYRPTPPSVEGFHALQEVISVSRPGGFGGLGAPPFECCYTCSVLSL